MQAASRFIVVTLGVCFVALAVVVSINAKVDPFVQYHAPGPTTRFVTGFARHMNAGLARNANYDSVLVGSSYAMNFRNSDFDRAFGGRTINVTMPGMFVSEGMKMLNFAAQQRSIKRVYFGLDFFAFVEKDRLYEWPDYLYDNRWWNDAPYLMSLDTLKRSMYETFRLGSLNYNTDADKPWSWATRGANLGRPRVLADYESKRAQPWRKQYLAAEMIMQARRELLPFIEAHPGIHFEFFLPPYSVLAWQLDTGHGEIDALLKFRTELAQLLAKYPHVRLHDFQAWEDQICDLDRYTDVGHYGPDINREMVTLMQKGTFSITPKQIDAANTRIRSLVEDARCGAAAAARS